MIGQVSFVDPGSVGLLARAGTGLECERDRPLVGNRDIMQ